MIQRRVKWKRESLCRMAPCRLERGWEEQRTGEGGGLGFYSPFEDRERMNQLGFKIWYV